MGRPTDSRSRESSGSPPLRADCRRRNRRSRSASGSSREDTEASGAPPGAGLTALLTRLAVNCVRGWTWLYTWRMPPAFRETRRAEIESDLWEFQCDAAGDPRLDSPLHILLRFLIGIPDESTTAECGRIFGTGVLGGTGA